MDAPFPFVTADESASTVVIPGLSPYGENAA